MLPKLVPNSVCVHDRIQQLEQLRAAFSHGPRVCAIFANDDVSMECKVRQHRCPEVADDIVNNCCSEQPGADHFEQVFVLQVRRQSSDDDGCGALLLKSVVQRDEAFKFSAPLTNRHL